MCTPTLAYRLLGKFCRFRSFWTFFAMIEWKLEEVAGAGAPSRMAESRKRAPKIHVNPLDEVLTMPIPLTTKSKQQPDDVVYCAHSDSESPPYMKAGVTAPSTVKKSRYDPPDDEADVPLLNGVVSSWMKGKNIGRIYDYWRWIRDWQVFSQSNGQAISMRQWFRVWRKSCQTCVFESRVICNIPPRQQFFKITPFHQTAWLLNVDLVVPGWLQLQCARHHGLLQGARFRHWSSGLEETGCRYVVVLDFYGRPISQIIFQLGHYYYYLFMLLLLLFFWRINWNFFI